MASKRYLSDIDLSNNEVKQFLLENLSLNPTPLYKGRIWIDSVLNVIKYYDGSSVKIIDSSVNGTGVHAIVSAESEGESSTTSSTYQTKLTLTANNLIAGDYVIFFYSECRVAKANKSMDLQIIDNLSNIYAERTTRPTLTGVVDCFCGFKKFTLSVGGNYVFYLKFRINIDDVGETCYIRRARLMIEGLF